MNFLFNFEIVIPTTIHANYLCLWGNLIACQWTNSHFNSSEKQKSVKSSRDNSDFGFSNNSSKHFTLSHEDCESQSSQRDSFPLGAGCLPCTPKSGKKNLEKISKQICKQFYSSNWCCGDVANMVKKTTKKTLNFILFYLSCK